jgi:hypothetical protein
MRVVVIIAENLIAAGYVANKKGTIIFMEKVKDGIFLAENGNSEVWETISSAYSTAFVKAAEAGSARCSVEYVRKSITEQQLFDIIEENKK